VRKKYLVRLYTTWKRDISFIPYQMVKDAWGPEDQLFNTSVDIEIDLGSAGEDDDEGDDDDVLVEGPSDEVVQEMEQLKLDS
jgi:hypothetical protein